MGPLIAQNIIDPAWNNVFAVLLGMAFGFILESSGFSSSRKLVGVFYGYDFVVLKVFMSGAVTASVGLFLFDYLGWIDMSLVYINPTYLYGAIGGGIIMGLGFITGGFCPGTSMAAASIGKIDAWIFTLFLGIGILLFSVLFPLLEGFYNAMPLGPVRVYESLHMSANLFLLLFIIVTLAAFIFAGWVNKRIRKVEY